MTMDRFSNYARVRAITRAYGLTIPTRLEWYDSVKGVAKEGSPNNRCRRHHFVNTHSSSFLRRDRTSGAVVV